MGLQSILICGFQFAPYDHVCLDPRAHLLEPINWGHPAYIIFKSLCRMVVVSLLVGAVPLRAVDFDWVPKFEQPEERRPEPSNQAIQAKLTN